MTVDTCEQGQQVQGGTGGQGGQQGQGGKGGTGDNLLCPGSPPPPGRDDVSQEMMRMNNFDCDER